MTTSSLQRSQLAAAFAAVTLLAGAGGYYLAGSRGSETGAETARKPLYYYDPMVPQEHYDNPDSLSSMGMETIPKYADESSGPAAKPGVTIDPSAMQNLGIRLATATNGRLARRYRRDRLQPA
jgi:Cu(I)/Ag(I) efflux system membrane fusion protein